MPLSEEEYKKIDTVIYTKSDEYLRMGYEKIMKILNCYREKKKCPCQKKSTRK